MRPLPIRDERELTREIYFLCFLPNHETMKPTETEKDAAKFEFPCVQSFVDSVDLNNHGFKHNCGLCRKNVGKRSHALQCDSCGS